MTVLEELIALLEAGEGKDQQLEEAIFEAVYPTKATKTVFIPGMRRVRAETSPAFTTSLDDVIKAIETRFPGRSHGYLPAETGRFRGMIGARAGHFSIESAIVGRGSSPARALSAALMSAIQVGAPRNLAFFDQQQKPAG